MNTVSNAPLYDVLDNLSERMCQSATTQIAKEQHINLRDVLNSKANHSDIYEFALRDGIYYQLTTDAKALLTECSIDMSDKDAVFNELHSYFANYTPQYITDAVRSACITLDLIQH